MKKIRIVLLFCLLAGILNMNAQVSINTDGSPADNSAILDIKSLSKGILIPRVTQAQRNAFATPAPGLMIFQTDNTPGVYFNGGTSASPAWVMVGTGISWSLTGNSGTNLASNFIGTTDNTPVAFKVNNQPAGRIDHLLFNTSLGFQSLASNTTGNINTAYGCYSLFSNTTGSFNTALGYQSLYFNTDGNENTAVGYRSLDFNNSGDYNTAIGNDALHSNNSGSYNTAAGFQALYSNSTGISNTACGVNALYSNTIGNDNAATGYQSLNSNTTGSANTASGKTSLTANISGSHNTASGFQALFHNTTASRNIAIGSKALESQSYSNSGVTWNSDNVAVGYETLYSNQPTSVTTGINNTAIGNYALYSNTTGFENTANGSEALYSNTNGNHNTACGFVSLYTNSGGVYNTAGGYKSLYLNTSGSYNTAGGYGSLNTNATGSNNTATGVFALYYIDTQDNNTAAGYSAGDYYKFDDGTFMGRSAYPNASGYSNVMGLGYNSRPTASNQVKIGNTAVTSIGGYAGWTDFSDGRFKKNVRENVPGLSFINQLRPVTYNLDVQALNADLDRNKPKDLREGEPPMSESQSERDGIESKEKIIYTGFIAQEVEAAAESIGFDFSGVDAPKNESDHYGLRYAEFVVPLVKAVQELSAENKQQQMMIEELIEKNRALEQKIDARGAESH